MRGEMSHARAADKIDLKAEGLAALSLMSVHQD